MYAYGYNLVYTDELKKAKKNTYQIKRDDSFDFDTTQILYLNNNQYRKVSITSDKSFDNLQKNQKIFFDVQDVVTFWANISSDIIYYKLHKNGTHELVNYWLTHTFLPILLTIENKYYYIHGGAVNIEDKAVLFIANSFGGKSTLTDFFIKKNHTMISDDKVATYLDEDKVIAVPSYPYHRPYRKVEDLGLYTQNFQERTSEINSIYNLIKSPQNSEINISEIKGIEKFTALRYATDIDLRVNTQSRFDKLSTIANKLKVYNIIIPWDKNRLEEVYKSIISHQKETK